MKAKPLNKGCFSSNEVTLENNPCFPVGTKRERTASPEADSGHVGEQSRVVMVIQFGQSLLVLFFTLPRVPPWLLTLELQNISTFGYQRHWKEPILLAGVAKERRLPQQRLCLPR